jgi:hypothetical protein
MNDLLELPDGECGDTLKRHTRRLAKTARIQRFGERSAADRLQGCGRTTRTVIGRDLARK